MNAVSLQNQQNYNLHAKSWCEAMEGNLAHKYLEKPAMDRELPRSLEGKHILCVGVGSGDEIDGLLRRNPKSITGIDTAQSLLDLAKDKHRGETHVSYHRRDMLETSFADGEFDYIYSSLTFHYADDWDVLFAEMSRILTKTGEILFSVHHPVYWSKNPTGNQVLNKRGILTTEHTGLLLGKIEITYYNHASTEAVLEAVTHAGFAVHSAFVPEVVEVDLETFAGDREEYRDLRQRNESKSNALFYVVRATKGGG